MLIARPALELSLRQALSRSPAVALIGARQVGKTTLARDLAQQLKGTLYLDLETSADLRKLEEAEPFLRAKVGRLKILDEVQYAPHLLTEIARHHRSQARSRREIRAVSSAGFGFA